MKADFSRSTFDARKHYSAVLLQQGRVQVDADWNEQQQIHAHRSERVAADIVGPSGAPNTSPGFGLGFTADGTDLSITPGRFYVDGLMCEIDAGEVYGFSTSGDNNVALAVPRPDLADLETGQWVLLSVTNGGTQVLRITGVSVSDTAVSLALSAAVAKPTPAPAGNFGGSLQRISTYLTQPDLPSPALATAAADGTPSVLALAKGLYVAYLDVWQRHVSALDDPEIRETALGGPDTATRAKTVWQLKLLAVTAPAAQAPVCGTDFPEWDALTQVDSGGLSARAAPPEGQAGPCLIPPGGGYQGLENQLYRIEIHDPGADGTATFKWSRDNGSVVTRILSFNGSSLTVDSTGPDDALGLANGEWVEILGDVEELQGLPGQLLQITTVSPATSTVSFAAPPATIDASLNPKMRRWDSAGPLPIAAGGGDWTDLELGVQVIFTAGQYATGDYWLVPARSGAAASVEWPHALPQLPKGVNHHFARLGLINWGGTVASSTVTDCRPTFAPLTEIPPALHVTGISWPNDDVVQLDQFTAGLSLTLDGAPITDYAVDLDPTDANSAPITLSLMTANDNSVIVTIDMPIPVPNPIGDATLTMPAQVVLSGDPIAWVAATNTLLWVPSASAKNIISSVSGGQARVSVRLKGDCIWGDQGQQRLYLDGQARGQPGLSTSRTQSLRTDLAFPSGSGRSSSDFESWFMLQFAVTPAQVQAFFMVQSVLVGSGSVTAQVVLATLAQSAVTVNLSNASSPAIAVTVNGGTDLTIGAGQSTANIAVNVNAPGSSSTVTLTASVTDQGLTTTQSTSFTVVVLSVGVSPPTALLLSGASQRFTASVNPVVAGGVPFTLPAGVNTGVTWSCSGGSIDQTGLFVAPAGTTTCTVTATSIADPTVSAQATVNVRTKDKDKDKDKEIREKPVVDKAVAIEKSVIIESKVRDVVVSPQLGPVVNPLVIRAAPAVEQRSFITPAERPQVGPAAPEAPPDEHE